MVLSPFLETEKRKKLIKFWQFWFHKKICCGAKTFYDVSFIESGKRNLKDYLLFFPAFKRSHDFFRFHNIVEFCFCFFRLFFWQQVSRDMKKFNWAPWAASVNIQFAKLLSILFFYRGWTYKKVLSSSNNYYCFSCKLSAASLVQMTVWEFSCSLNDFSSRKILILKNAFNAYRKPLKRDCTVEHLARCWWKTERRREASALHTSSNKILKIPLKRLLFYIFAQNLTNVLYKP